MSRLRPLPSAGSEEYRRLVERRPTAPDVETSVRQILADVRSRGDAAVIELTERFDHVRLSTTRVDPGDCRAALARLESPVREALVEMARRIELVHQAQQFHEQAVVVRPGIRVWREWRPFRRVGVYAPGGRTVYPSSVLMMAIPARLAGCQEIVLCCPPQSNGRVASVILAAAALAGVTEVHAVGGAQAIAALAYGTKMIQRVDMIAGPGNAYVTAAKLAVFGEVAIDLPAGPSEVVVISDGSVDARWLNADLQAQVEHSPDAAAILLTTTESDGVALQETADSQVNGFLVTSLEVAIDFANAYAPEHLALACAAPERYLARVTSAGSIFLGPYAGPAAGDYATGASHVLPTGGSARSFGPLGVERFGRPVQVQQVDAAAVASLAEVTDVLAEIEKLPHHGRSVRIRSQR